MSFLTEFFIFIGCQSFIIFILYPFLNWYLDEEQVAKRQLIRKAVRDSKFPVSPVYSDRKRKQRYTSCPMTGRNAKRY